MNFSTLESIIVKAEEMRQIEERMFAAGMPVAALMEKVADLCAKWVQNHYNLEQYPSIGVLVGPGHNGGDACVIARELYLQGYRILIYSPFTKLKDLTSQHLQYAKNLGIPIYEDLKLLENCHLMIDGLFGFGLTRHLTGIIAGAVHLVNSWHKPTISIDIPSGLHTDTGSVLGVAIKATDSLCLGLWKRAYFQDQALPYLGNVYRIDFGIPITDIFAVLSDTPSLQILTSTLARQCLPLPRFVLTHKYQQGHLLLICGSHRYAGGAILTGLGARASGVGMLSMAVPARLKPLLNAQLPDALIIDCPETETGAIAELSPLALDFSQYNAIACGPGLTLDSPILESVLTAECPLILDADGLNLLVREQKIGYLSQRSAKTILTPHLGEFRRLFPQIQSPEADRLTAVQQAAQESQTIILFKGARTAIADPQGHVWIIPESTPALARGGSGDVLTGLIGGLVAQDSTDSLECRVATAAYWHAQAGCLAAQERTELGVDARTLSDYLLSVLSLLSDWGARIRT